MSYKILEQNGVENEVVDGGALNNFCAGNRDGIIAGVLSECALAAAGNGVAISPGLLIICGVRIKITAAETLYVSSVPLKATRYQIIAQITLGADGNTSAEFFLQSNASLKRDAIYAQGYGTYQAEIGSFTHNPDGSISDMVRTLDVLYGGGNGSANIEVGNVVTQTLPAGQDAEFDMTARNENGKTIFDVKALIPRGASGTDDEAVHFTPQTLTEAQKAQARANINALSAAEADIQHIAVDCDHEYEITGYTGHEWNVAVPDHCQLTVTRIKGQTRRKSLNLFKVTDEITINSGSEQWVFYHTDTLKSWGLVEGKTYTITAYNLPDGILCQFIPGYYSLTNFVYTFTFASGMQFRIGNNTVSQQATFTPQIMIVEGSYTAETIPPYQPFDDTLVNSRVKKVLSTGANLFDYANSGYVDGKDINANGSPNPNKSYTENYTRVQPNYTYSVTFIDGVYNTYSIYYYDINKTLLFSIDSATSGIVFTTPANCYYIRFSQYYASGDGVSKKPTQVMLNYGSSALPYVPYISDDTFSVDKEITGFGEINNISKQFTEYGSNILILDGSSDEEYTKSEGWANAWCFGYILNIPSGVNETYYNDTKSIVSNYLPTIEPQNIAQNESVSNGIGVSGSYVFFSINGITDILTLREYLSANPLRFVYKMATPRIQKSVNIQAGYSAHKGGLQQQVIEGDYLPYIITKDYPVSGADQILKNLEIDRDQGKMLDAIRQGALPVGKLANAITIISGDTKKTFDGSTPVEITASGEQGPEGPPGEQGVPGEAATITIRNVDVGTALPEQPASVVIKNVGTSTNAILDFGFMIPRGKPGEQGKRGEQGVPGKSSLMSVVIMNPVIGGSSYYGRILLTCPVPSTGIPNNGFENLEPALKFQEYQVSGIISLDQSTLNAKRVYGLRKLASNGVKLYALIDSQTISAVEAGEELTGASAVVFAQL